MGLISEPKDIDLVIGPSKLTKEDKQFISQIIADYKRTGKRPRKSKQTDFADKTNPLSKKKKVSF